DQKTKLIWQRCPSTLVTKGGCAPDMSTFDEATVYCSMLTLDTGATGHGVMGWRVPSYKELLTLVDEAPHTEYEDGALVYKYIDGNAFLGTPTDRVYWTSSLAPNFSPRSAFAVDFANGTGVIQRYANERYHVRCVHD